MSLKSVNCPHCHSKQAAPAGTAAGQQVRCARCGQSFAAGAARGRERNFPVVLASLGAVLVVGVLGLAYWLMTRDFRPAGGEPAPGKPRQAPVDLDMVNENPTPPARMEGLGYLPPATNAVAGAYIRDLRFRVMAYNLLRKPLPVGSLKLKLDQLATWTGLPLREMDHVLLGAVLPGGEGDGSRPPLTLVVRTVLDHDQQKVRKTMKAAPPVTAAGADGVERALYAAQLGPLPVRLLQPDKKTVVIGLFDDEMKHVPGKPHEGARRLPAELRDALENRVVGTPSLWAVGHSADWDKSPVPALFKPLTAAGPLAGQLGRLRTVALWMTFEYDPKGGKLFWRAQAPDAKAARELERTALAAKGKSGAGALTASREGAWLKVELTVYTGPPPGPGHPGWGAAPPPAPRQPTLLAERAAPWAGKFRIDPASILTPRR